MGQMLQLRCAAVARTVRATIVVLVFVNHGLAALPL